MNRGYGDGLARAVEVVVAPLLFGSGGYLLDEWLGTGPILTILLGAYGVVGVFVKLWLEYDREMREHESALVRDRRRRAAPASAATASPPASGATATIDPTTRATPAARRSTTPAAEGAT